MGSLDVWGAIAASFLLLQCLVLNLVFVAIALGLWKGSEWVHAHASSGLAKAGEWLRLGQSYARRGQSLLSAPFVRVRSRVAGTREILQRLKG